MGCPIGVKQLWSQSSLAFDLTKIPFSIQVKYTTVIMENNFLYLENIYSNPLRYSLFKKTFLLKINLGALWLFHYDIDEKLY